MDILRTGLLFVLTGLAEIDGGWLVWQWLRNNWGWPWGSLGGAMTVSLWRIADAASRTGLWPRLFCYLGYDNELKDLSNKAQ